MKKRGFTLIETLIAVGIFVAISIIIGNFSRNLFFFNSDLNNSLSLQFDARQILKKIVAELRPASPSSLGGYTLAATATSSITFYSDIDNDSLKEQLRYFLQGNELRRGVIKPSGNPLTYTPGSETVSIVASSIINGTSTPIFDYFDKNYAGTSSPLSSPVNTSLVRLIRITLILDKDQNRPPSAVTVTTQVMLRNLKDNL